MTTIVMVMPYQAYLDKGQDEGFKIHAVWDERVAHDLYGSHATEYLDKVRRTAAALYVSDFRDTKAFSQLLREVARDTAAEWIYHVGGEDSMLAAYDVAEELGLAVNSTESVANLNDKLRMRRLLNTAGVSFVQFRVVDHWRDVASALDAFELPVVVKPSRLAGSRGVMLLHERAQLPAWAALLQSHGYDGPILIEEYLRGPEYSVESLSSNGKHTIVGITRKVLGQPPWFVELGHVHPAPPPDESTRIGELVTRLLDLTGYRTGPAHTEIICTERGPRIVESQARLGGDRIPKLVQLSTGVDMERGVFRALAGAPIPEPRHDAVARIGYFSFPPGRITRVNGLDALRELDGIDEVSFPFGVGDTLPEVTDWRSRHGYAIMSARTHDDVEKCWHRARSTLRVDVVEAGGR